MKLLNTLVVLPLLAAAVPVYEPASTGTPFTLSSLEKPGLEMRKDPCSPRCVEEWTDYQDCNTRQSCYLSSRIQAFLKAYVSLSQMLFFALVHDC